MGEVLTSSFSAPSRRLNVISPIRCPGRVPRQAGTRTKTREFRHYLGGLLGESETKNVFQIARDAVEVTYHKLHHCLDAVAHGGNHASSYNGAGRIDFWGDPNGGRSHVEETSTGFHRRRQPLGNPRNGLASQDRAASLLDRSDLVGRPN